MDKKKVIIGVVIVIILMVGMGFWKWKGVKNSEVLRDNQSTQQQQQNLEQDQQQNQREQEKDQQYREDTIDALSLKLYGSRAGVQGEGATVSTSDWLTEKNGVIDFSFLYPQNAKIIDEGNCYRVEYGLGFAIFFLPLESAMRCGARTGVGVLPDNVDVTDYLTIGEKKYEAPGFNAVMDTKGEKFFSPEKRYFYDFHHMFDLNKNKNCGNTGECMRVGYGIYKEVSTPLNKKDIDNTMNTLRAIIESINYTIQK